MALVCLLAASAALSGRLRREMRDFEVYWTAGQRAASAEPLYREADGHYRFKYLPAFAVAVSPLGALSLGAAKATWTALSVVCLVYLLAWSARLARPAGPQAALAWLTGLALAKFFAHELVLGQANLLFAAGCTGALVLLVRGRDASAGALFGLATLVKPYALVFLPYLLLTRRWRAAGAAGAGIACVLVAPAAVYGFNGTVDLTRDWWRAASDSSLPLLTNPDSVSILAMYTKWLGWGTLAGSLALATIGVLAVGVLAVLARRITVATPEALEVGLLLTAIPLVTPQGWDYVLLLSAPLIALLISRFGEMRSVEQTVFAVALAVAALSLYDVMGRQAYAAFMGLAVVTVCYLAIAAVAVRLRWRAVA